MLCIFGSSSYRGACFKFVPLVRHQSAYFDTLSGIFRKCNRANAFWTRYLETAISWRFRIVQKSVQMSYMAIFIIVPPKQWDGQINQRLIFIVELAKWRRTCEIPNSSNSNSNSWLTMCQVKIYAFAFSFPLVHPDGKGNNINWTWTHLNVCIRLQRKIHSVTKNYATLREKYRTVSGKITIVQLIKSFQYESLEIACPSFGWSRLSSLIYVN